MRTRVRAISYFLSIIAIAAIFFSIEHFTERFFFHDDDVVDIAAAIMVAVSFSECRRFFDRATDRIFLHGPRDDRAELFTNISHELQTPIAILRGNVEFLQRRGISDDERAAAERVIVTTLDGMSRLIGGVLESAKLRSSKGVLHQGIVDVGSLLREVHEDFSLLAQDKGIVLAVDIDVGRATDISICGDRGKLKEVMLNLISNALKYTLAGGTVILRAKHADGMARIEVEDSGSGIAPEVLPHVFERFYRIEHFAVSAPGNGIGLNICRQIVEAHGGTIRAESDAGKGSRFIVCLPLAAPSRKSVPTRTSAIINS